MVEGGKGRRRTPKEVDLALAALTWAAAEVLADMELEDSDTELRPLEGAHTTKRDASGGSK